VVLGLGLLLLTAAVVAAHEGEGEGEELAVDPSTVTAGDTAILAGSGLEPYDERVIVLAGENLIVEFGTATTDAEGAFQTELTIPSHLPGGVYELRAIGDETLTVPLSITAAPGGAAASPAPNGAGQTVVPRQRSTVEWGVIAILVVLAAVAGGLLVWRAERFRGAPST
jgi:hypothetical protein